MSRINNYEELLVEQRKTEAIITEQKQLLASQLQDFTKKMQPLLHLLPIVNIFKKDSNDGTSNSLLKMGASLAIDLLVGQKLLRKANWFAKLIVPALLKTVSSKVIGSNGNAKVLGP